MDLTVVGLDIEVVRGQGSGDERRQQAAGDGLGGCIVDQGDREGWSGR